MAIARVTTATATFNSTSGQIVINTTAGNLIFIFIAIAAGTTVNSLSDLIGTLYTKVAAHTNASTTVRAELWAGIAPATNAANSVTINLSLSTKCAVCAGTYSGVVALGLILPESGSSTLGAAHTGTQDSGGVGNANFTVAVIAGNGSATLSGLSTVVATNTTGGGDVGCCYAESNSTLPIFPVNMQCNISASEDWTSVAVELRTEVAPSNVITAMTSGTGTFNAAIATNLAALDVTTGYELVVVIGIAKDAATVSNVTDGAGTAFTQKVAVSNVGAVRVEIWRGAPGIIKAANGINVTLSSSAKCAVIAQLYGPVLAPGATATNTGSSNTPSVVSPASVDTDNWAIAGFAAQGVGTYTANVGNLRASIVTSGSSGASNVGTAENDNTTAASGATITNTVTLSASESWAAVVYLLRGRYVRTQENLQLRDVNYINTHLTTLQDNLKLFEQIYINTHFVSLLDDFKLSDIVSAAKPALAALSLTDNFRLTDLYAAVPVKRLQENAQASDVFSLTTVKVLLDDLRLTDFLTLATLKVLEDNLQLTDTFNRLPVKALLDDFQFTDTLHLTQFRALQDNLELTDTFARVPVKALQENIQLTEVLSKTQFRSFQDNLELTDLFTRVPVKALSDNLELTESRVFTLLKVLSDNLQLTDTLHLTQFRALQDNLELTDIFRLTQVRILQDNLQLTDLFTRLPVKALQDNIELTDTIHLTQFRSFQDNLELTDVYAAVPVKALLDDLQLTDTIHLTQFRSFQDNLELTDVITLVKQFTRSFQDNLQLTDTLTRTPVKVLLDDFQLTETLTRNLVKVLLDGIQLTDVFHLTQLRILQDNLQLSDVVTRSTVKVLLDDLELTDTIHLAQFRALQDNLELTDVFARLPVKALQDNMQLTEVLSKTQFRTLQENLRLTDTLTLTTLKVLFDNLELTDIFSIIKQAVGILTLSLQDNLRLTDTILFRTDKLLLDSIRLSEVFDQAFDLRDLEKFRLIVHGFSIGKFKEQQGQFG